MRSEKARRIVHELHDMKGGKPEASGRAQVLLPSNPTHFQTRGPKPLKPNQGVCEPKGGF